MGKKKPPLVKEQNKWETKEKQNIPHRKMSPHNFFDAFCLHQKNVALLLKLFEAKAGISDWSC